MVSDFDLPFRSEEPPVSRVDTAFEDFCDRITTQELISFWREFVGLEPKDIKEDDFWYWLRNIFERSYYSEE